MDYLQEFLLFNRRFKRNDNSHRTALMLQKQGDDYIFNYLCNIFVNRIKWKYTNEEETINTELLEKSILFDGVVALSQYNGIWLNFRPSIINDISFYNFPSSVQLFDYVGRSYGIHVPISPYDFGIKSDCVLIYNDQFKTRPIDTIIYFAQRLSYINTQINAAIKNLRGSAFMFCTEEQKKELNKIMTRGNDGTPVQFITLDTEDPNVYKPQLLTTPEIPDVLKCLYEAWDKTMSDFLNSIGIRSNSEMNKKSGVTPLEITENRQNTDIILNGCIEERLKCLELGKKIGLEGLSVSLSNFEPRTVDESFNKEIEEGQEVKNDDEFEKSNI